MQLSFLLEEFDHNRRTWKTPWVLLQLRKSQFLPLAIPFSMHAGVYAQHLDMRLQVSVCFRRISSQRLDLLFLQLVLTDLRGYRPKQDSSTRTHVPCRHKTKIQSFYTSNTLLSRLLNWKLDFNIQHWCDTDPRLVFLLPPLFPQGYPAKTTEARHFDWPKWSQLFQRPSKDLVCDYVGAESKT